MTDDERGIYEKYLVTNNETGEVVRDCFILRPDRDVAALHALEAYAAHCWHNEQLQNDIRAWVAQLWTTRRQEMAG